MSIKNLHKPTQLKCELIFYLFSDKVPTPQALQNAQDFLNCAVYKKHLDMNYGLVGHQQLSLTLSPGASLQSIIKNWPHWINDVSKL